MNELGPEAFLLLQFACRTFAAQFRRINYNRPPPRLQPLPPAVADAVLVPNAGRTTFLSSTTTVSREVAIEIITELIAAHKNTARFFARYGGVPGQKSADCHIRRLHC